MLEAIEKSSVLNCLRSELSACFQVFSQTGLAFIFGAVAQLEERVVRNDEVGSSNLLGSTIFFRFYNHCEALQNQERFGSSIRR
jgi:hypothetical protein